MNTKETSAKVNELTARMLEETSEAAKYKGLYAQSQKTLHQVAQRGQSVKDDSSTIDVVLNAVEEGYDVYEGFLDVIHFVITGEGIRPDSSLSTHMEKVNKAKEEKAETEALSVEGPLPPKEVKEKK